MDKRKSRLHSSSSSSISRSRSPISDNEKRSISTSPRRGPSTPVKSSSIQRNDSDEEQDLNRREISKSDENSKTIMDEPSSPIMSDNEQIHHKKRTHRRHHHHRHHKQSKSNKRSASHHQHSAKRSKKETVSPVQQNKSDESSQDKNTSGSEKSKSEQEISSEDEEEEGVIQGNSDNSPPSERHSRRHHKKRRLSSENNERNSQSPQSSAVSVPKNNKGTQLIVNYLPASLRESDFYQLFARIAPIKLCKLITDRHTGHSYCYGFIEYHSKDEAIKAIKKYNGYRIEHKKLKVSYAQPKTTNDDSDNEKPMNTTSQKNPNIYITELPDDFDEKMLQRLFSKYGEIVQTKILRDPRTRISRGVGFVLMTSTRYAERAVKALDGYVPSGSHTPISVKYADPKKTATLSGNTSSPSSSRLSMGINTGAYGYPPVLPPLGMIDPYYAAALHHHHRAAMNMRDLSPSPPPLPSYYSTGNSRSSRMRSSSPGLPRSYSSSSSKHSSNLLSTSLNNSSSRSSNPNPSLTNNPTLLSAAYDLIAKGCQQAIDPNGFVIYAFGLPHDCDENDLEELFRRYGEVYRVYIVRNYTTGESKGYSFVTMRNYDEACHAVDRLNGSAFQGRTIQVRFKQ